MSQGKERGFHFLNIRLIQNKSQPRGGLKAASFRGGQVQNDSKLKNADDKEVKYGFKRWPQKFFANIHTTEKAFDWKQSD
jgi:hypothetical protein